MAGTNGTGYHFQRGWYRIGDHITATVTFTETITVTGAPELRINVGRSSKIASFETANGTTAAFTYTVIEGDSDSDGISISPNRLTLSGGTIKDDANNDAVLSYSAVSTLATHTRLTVYARDSGISAYCPCGDRDRETTFLTSATRYSHTPNSLSPYSEVSLDHQLSIYK